MRIRLASPLVWAGAGILTALIASTGWRNHAPQPAECPCPKFTHDPARLPADEIRQEFPSRSAEAKRKTGWRVQWAKSYRWTTDPQTKAISLKPKEFFIVGAWFRRWIDGEWVEKKIVSEIRLAEIFVPYDDGNYYYDRAEFLMLPALMSGADLGCCGRFVDASKQIAAEVRSRGVAWHGWIPPDPLKPGEERYGMHRGEKLVLWSAIKARHYVYIVEFGFHDDGTIACRMGATAKNLPTRAWTRHVHQGYWRIDVDLDGRLNNRVLLTRRVHHDTDNVAVHATPDISSERACEYKPRQFSKLRVHRKGWKNSHGKEVAFDLVPIRAGTNRHEHKFTHHDFWVTKYEWYERHPARLPDYANGEKLKNSTDVVLWHASPLFHDPRSEDGELLDGTWVGSAMVMWAGFDLRPRDLFDRTPFYPYRKD